MLNRFRASWMFLLAVLLTQAVCAQNVAEQYLVAALNQERAASGMSALAWNPQLAAAARQHAIRMAQVGAISHHFAGEQELADRTSAMGAQFSSIAENVAVGQTAITLHEAWMHSPGHRANILDASLTSVGIAVVPYRGRLWAVQDFARDVANLSLNEQETRVQALLQRYPMLHGVAVSDDARGTCGLSTGFAGDRRPSFVVRYTASNLSRLPDQLTTRFASGKYTHAEVGACHGAKGTFTSYNIAVMLFP